MWTFVDLLWSQAGRLKKHLPPCKSRTEQPHPQSGNPNVKKGRTRNHSRNHTNNPSAYGWERPDMGTEIGSHHTRSPLACGTQRQTFIFQLLLMTKDRKTTMFVIMIRLTSKSLSHQQADTCTAQGAWVSAKRAAQVQFYNASWHHSPRATWQFVW